MWSILLGLFKNPLTSLVVDKTIGEVKHYLDLKKIERVAELEAAKSIQVAQIQASEKSWKDEWLTIFTSAGLALCFIPKMQPFMIKGFEIIKAAPPELLYAVLVVYCGSFGMNVIDKFKK